MDLTKLSDPLRVDQIEFRVQSINNGGYAIILAYKDARCDMQRLDDVCGPLNWKREHSRDNQNCTVSIYDKDADRWVGKEDTGTESSAEKQKGLASDSFKRSCFNWGIGRELYDYPIISVKLNGDGSPLQKGDYSSEWVKQGKNGKPQQTWNLKLKEWLWYSEFDENNKISFLAARDSNGIRFKWGKKREVKK